MGTEAQLSGAPDVELDAVWRKLVESGNDPLSLQVWVDSERSWWRYCWINSQACGWIEKNEQLRELVIRGNYEVYLVADRAAWVKDGSMHGPHLMLVNRADPLQTCDINVGF